MVAVVADVALVAVAAFPPILQLVHVPVRLVIVPLDGVPNAPPLITGAPAVPTFTPKAVAIPVPSPVTLPTAGAMVAVVTVVN